jgi:hypothetical protein
MVFLQDILNKNINKCYNKINKTVYVEELNKLYKFYYDFRTTDKPLYPLVLFIIKDNSLDIEVIYDGKTHNKNYLKEMNDDRITGTFNLINKTLKYMKKRNIDVPNTTLYIWISDAIPWYKEIDTYFPIYTFAKPKNTNYIIFPDCSFNCITLEQKYNGTCYNWNQIKKILVDKCNYSLEKDKINSMYFKGTPTTKRHSKIRENLEEYSKKNKWLDIKLDAWQNYVSMDNFCKYKYLLNIPGHYPWSNRFKYLFLMKSLIINIDISTVGTNEDSWITFIDFIVKPNKHYINLKMDYHYSDRKDKEKQEQNKQLNYLGSVKIVDELKKIYNEDITKYNDMIVTGYNRVSKLKNKHLYKYIYHCIVQNSLITFI